MAGCPYGVPSAQLGHPEPRNGHAHLGYVLASPVSRTLKARATPQRFLARIQHGLTMALDADRAYTHRLTKTPDHPTWRTFWERPDPYELGELRDYLGDRLPLRIARLEAVGRGGTSRCSMACGSGHIEHGWATRIGTCGSVLVAPR